MPLKLFLISEKKDWEAILSKRFSRKNCKINGALSDRSRIK